MSTKFNIYYANTPTGPWTLANTTPLDKVDGLNEYTISGLDLNKEYYVRIIGGTLNNEGEFVSLMNQPIGPNTEGARTDIEALPSASILVKPHAPKTTSTTNLGHEFEVV